MSNPKHPDLECAEVPSTETGPPGEQQGSVDDGGEDRDNFSSDGEDEDHHRLNIMSDAGDYEHEACEEGGNDDKGYPGHGSTGPKLSKSGRTRRLLLLAKKFTLGGTLGSNLCSSVLSDWPY
jgi:hypothetical protein